MWQDKNNQLYKEFTFKDFTQAFAFMTEVAKIAEQRNHHPDIDIRWRTLTFRCSTHSAGGLTEFDVALAHAVSDEIAAAGG